MPVPDIALVPEEYIDFDLTLRLDRDLAIAAGNLTPLQQRFLVDMYYQVQESRKSAANQLRSAREEPNAFITMLAAYLMKLERTIVSALNKATDQRPVTAWAKRQHGIGPVLTAGFAAHIDIHIAKTPSAIWRYAGLDPTVKWAKGQKRPWNAALKVLSWKLGDCFCLKPDQTVTTRRGYIPICEVVRGDEVLTHHGRWQRVTDVLVRDYAGPLVQLRAFGRANQGPWVTYGHPVYTRQRPVIYYSEGERQRWKHGGRVQEQRFVRAAQMRALYEEGLLLKEIATRFGVSEATVSRNVRYLNNAYSSMPVGWIDAEDIQRGWDIYSPTIPATAARLMLDFRSLPDLLPVGDHQVRARGNRAIPVPATVAVTEQVARLIGLYLAEGHAASHQGQLGWSFHLNERRYQEEVRQTIAEVFGLNSSLYEYVAGHSAQVIVASKPLVMLFAHLFGSHAHTKHLPPSWLETLGDAEARALLRGLYDGDGHDYHGDKPGEVLTTVSKTLAYQVHDLVRRLGMLASINVDKEVYKVRIQGREITAEWTPTGTWHSVKSIPETFYAGPVYNLEVANDESYVAEGIAVHNCKFHNHEKCFYGHIYAERKQLEVMRNARGDFAALAKETLEVRKIQDKETRLVYESGKLPAGRLELRARRVAVKLFLAHWFEVDFTHTFGVRPELSYILMHDPETHTHYIPPPLWDPPVDVKAPAPKAEDSEHPA